MQKSLKKILVLLQLFTAVSSTQSFAQMKVKTKAKIHKVKSSSSDIDD